MLRVIQMIKDTIISILVLIILILSSFYVKLRRKIRGY